MPKYEEGDFVFGYSHKIGGTIMGIIFAIDEEDSDTEHLREPLYWIDVIPPKETDNLYPITESKIELWKPASHLNPSAKDIYSQLDEVYARVHKIKNSIRIGQNQDLRESQVHTALSGILCDLDYIMGQIQ